jgi:hypothetical protein
MRAVLLFAVTMISVAGALTALADPPRRTIDASKALDAAVLPSVDPVITKTPPDPPALVERAQWVFDLRWDKGDVFLLGVHPLELPAPQATPRVMGRFAIELFEGPTLLERARFDFPLLGALEPEGGVSFSARLNTRIGVVFPASKRGTKLELTDRATGRRWALPWPVDASPAPSASASASGPAALTAPVDAGRRD